MFLCPFHHPALGPTTPHPPKSPCHSHCLPCYHRSLYSCHSPAQVIRSPAAPQLYSAEKIHLTAKNRGESHPSRFTTPHPASPHRIHPNLLFLRTRRRLSRPCRSALLQRREATHPVSPPRTRFQPTESIHISLTTPYAGNRYFSFNPATHSLSFSAATSLPGH